jgi:hypothetical protein
MPNTYVRWCTITTTIQERYKCAIRECASSLFINPPHPATFLPACSQPAVMMAAL